MGSVVFLTFHSLDICKQFRNLLVGSVVRIYKIITHSSQFRKQFWFLVMLDIHQKVCVVVDWILGTEEVSLVVFLCWLFIHCFGTGKYKQMLPYCIITLMFSWSFSSCYSDPVGFSVDC